MFLEFIKRRYRNSYAQAHPSLCLESSSILTLRLPTLKYAIVELISCLPFDVDMDMFCGHLSYMNCIYILTVTTAQKESIGIHASVLLFYQCFLKPRVEKKKRLPRDWVYVLVLTQTLWCEC